MRINKFRMCSSLHCSAEIPLGRKQRTLVNYSWFSFFLESLPCSLHCLMFGYTYFIYLVQFVQYFIALRLNGGRGFENAITF